MKFQRFGAKEAALLIVISIWPAFFNQTIKAQVIGGNWPCKALKELKTIEVLRRIKGGALAEVLLAGKLSTNVLRVAELSDEDLKTAQRKLKEACESGADIDLEPLLFPRPSSAKTSLQAASEVANAQSIPVGNFPVDLAAADFNGDGLPDVAVANQDSNNVSIILGQAGGTFGQSTNFPTGAGPNVIQTADFNGDQKVDIVTADQGNFPDKAGVSLLMGKGDGTFQPAVELNPEDSTNVADTALAVADFSGDGKDDLVVARLNAEMGIRVLLGKGDGTFQSPRDFDAFAYSLAVGDFNGDGTLDIAAGSNPLSVLLGDGKGNFQISQKVTFGFNGTLFQTQAADLDGDGDLDLVTTEVDNTVSVILNRGDGSFREPAFYAVNDFPEKLSLLDLDGDGILDLFVSNTNADHSSILFGNGDGTFVAGRAYAARGEKSSPSGLSSLAAADFNGDGLADVAVAAGNSSSILPGRPDGTLGSRLDLGRRGDFLTSADFNRDGQPDLALVRRTDDEGFVRPGVAILLGSGPGTFKDGSTVPIANPDFNSGPIFSAQINEDEFSDLLLIDRKSGVLKFYAGRGDGTFGAAVDTAVGTRPLQLALGDLNEDGRLDLVIGTGGNPAQLNGGVSVLLGKGDGTFQAPVEILGQTTGGRVALGDLNGDGHLDLVAENEKPQFTFNVTVLLGNGDGSFRAPSNLAPHDEDSFFGVGGLTITDFDQDGRADVLVGSNGDQALIIYPGNGDGSFQDPVSGDIGPDPAEMILADMNLDRKPDVALASGGLIVTVDNLSTSAGANTVLSVADRGGASTLSASAGGAIQVGYATATLDSGVTPYATGAFILKQGGVTVSEVGVPTSPPTLVARIVVDKRSGIPAPGSSGLISTDTGFAAANLGSKTAQISYRLRDLQGQVMAEGEGTLKPGEHLSKFVGQLQDVSTFVLPADFASTTGLGTLEVTSDQPVSMLGLRLTTNQRGEALLTSTPVADQIQPASSQPLRFPQFFDGGGGNTTVMLMNTTDTVESGTLEIFGDDGSPLVVTTSSGQKGSRFDYSIPAQGAFVVQTDGSSPQVTTGWTLVTPAPGSQAPVGAGVFQISSRGILATEAGVPSATPSRRIRLFVDRTGGHDTGVALANPNGSALSIRLKAVQLDGKAEVGQATVNLAAGGHTGKFAGELIPGLPSGFVGVLELSSSQPFAALTLRSLFNERGDFLITTFPVADLEQNAPRPLIFPQAASGAGILTQFIFLSSQGASQVTLNYFGQDGKPSPLAAER